MIIKAGSHDTNRDNERILFYRKKMFNKNLKDCRWKQKKIQKDENQRPNFINSLHLQQCNSRDAH